MHHPLPKLSLTPATSSPHHGPGQYPHSHTYPPPQAPTGFQPLNRYETHPRNDRLLPPISEQIMSGTLSQGGAFGANRKISRSASVVSLVQAYNEEGQMVNEMIFSPDGK
ncbi:hypothetical protein TCAL_14344 [Tigriopus californicus]|uniref:Uncharacterized protein n=1 Tax=Tigriopus californicus TaxID=6832 RepID=A0A553NAQ4_TIGCA|nr:hypothetical protein TCAL_14344 [Tigriopus californicus]